MAEMPAPIGEEAAIMNGARYRCMDRRKRRARTEQRNSDVETAAHRGIDSALGAVGPANDGCPSAVRTVPADHAAGVDLDNVAAPGRGAGRKSIAADGARSRISMII
jgi:hypothetical protein